jgi:hypothetical protein
LSLKVSLKDVDYKRPMMEAVAISSSSNAIDTFPDTQ